MAGKCLFVCTLVLTARFCLSSKRLHDAYRSPSGAYCSSSSPRLCSSSLTVDTDVVQSLSLSCWERWPKCMSMTWLINGIPLRSKSQNLTPINRIYLQNDYRTLTLEPPVRGKYECRVDFKQAYKTKKMRVKCCKQVTTGNDPFGICQPGNGTFFVETTRPASHEPNITLWNQKSWLHKVIYFGPYAPRRMQIVTVATGHRLNGAEPSMYPPINRPIKFCCWPEWGHPIPGNIWYWLNPYACKYKNLEKCWKTIGTGPGRQISGPSAQGRYNLKAVTKRDYDHVVKVPVYIQRFCLVIDRMTYNYEKLKYRCNTFNRFRGQFKGDKKSITWSIERVLARPPPDPVTVKLLPESQIITEGHTAHLVCKMNASHFDAVTYLDILKLRDDGSQEKPILLKRIKDQFSGKRGQVWVSVTRAGKYRCKVYHATYLNTVEGLKEYWSDARVTIIPPTTTAPTYTTTVTLPVTTCPTTATLQVATDHKTTAHQLKTDDSNHIFIAAMCGAGLGIVLLVCCIYNMCKRLSSLQPPVRTENTKSFKRKTVVIYRPIASDASNSASTDAVVLPQITIEGIRRCDSQELVAQSEYFIPVDHQFEFARESVELEEVIGEGAFGKVWQATADGILETGTKTRVAVKTVRDQATEPDLLNLVKELEILKSVGYHPNVIHLLGCCTRPDGPVMLILDYAANGSLKNFLCGLPLNLNATDGQPRGPQCRTGEDTDSPLSQDEDPQVDKDDGQCGSEVLDSQHGRARVGSGLHESLQSADDQALDGETAYVLPDPAPQYEAMGTDRLTVGTLVWFARQIASGMHYLCHKKIIHRDLAARNILVDGALTMKIADFGLTCQLDDDHYYYRNTKTTKLPIKWLAPEALDERKFTSKTDIWAYGIVLWEIFTLGRVQPYPNVIDWERMIPRLKQGYRMKKPENAPQEFYYIMKQCWATNPKDRPTFEEVVTMLDLLAPQINTEMPITAVDAVNEGQVVLVQSVTPREMLVAADIHVNLAAGSSRDGHSVASTGCVSPRELLVPKPADIFAEPLAAGSSSVS